MNYRILDNPKFYYALFAVLLLPALLINLGVHHLFVHTDESRRALVALEMILSGDYISPTLNGVAYLNKPPLYNWIIIGSFKVFHSYSALAVRFPVVIAVLFFGTSIFTFFKPYIGRWQAWLVAIATITSGRILFYDSFLGLIDILFSTLIFINFMLWYRWGRAGRYTLLFTCSYFLMAIAYLMKGLPPIVFQAFTILAYTLFLKDWRFLFRRSHFLGLLCFVLPVGAYYFIYFSNQEAPVADVLNTLWVESAKRTVTDHTIWQTLKASLSFPFENFYHFAPWTILLFGLWSKQVRAYMWSTELSRYLILIFICNIWVYWTSPGVHPRYLFMFVPLIFAIGFMGIEHPKNAKLSKWIQLLFGVIMTIGILLPIGLWQFAVHHDVESFATKMMLIFIGLGAIVALYWKKPAFRWVLLATFLVVVRIAFNWVILPERDKKGAEYAAAANEVVKLSEGKELAILGSNYCHDGTSFIISRARGEILPVKSVPEPGKYYIVIDFEFDPEKFETLYSFHTHGTDRTLNLVKLRSLPPNIDE